MLEKATKYLSDVRIEMSKVLWPTRAELRESSTIVVILSLILAVFTFSIDFIINRLLKLIF
jgi:preprotein translocase subunit SecE